MSKFTVAVASDHAGFELKEFARSVLVELGFDVLDLGCFSKDSVDYPLYGRAVGEAIADKRADKGLIVCGTGIGISIAANRNPLVRAALASEGLSARLARQHNDANVLALGARLIGEATARDCIEQFFTTDFEGGRHARRVDMLGN